MWGLILFLCLPATARDTVAAGKSAWYAQFGTWELRRDTASGFPFVFINTGWDRFDLKRRPLDLKSNLAFSRFRECRGLFRPEGAGKENAFGFILKDKKSRYCFLLREEPDSVYFFVYSQPVQPPSANPPPPARIFSRRLRQPPAGPWILLKLEALGDSLLFSAGRETARLPKPRDYESLVTFALAAGCGAAGVREAVVISEDHYLAEAFSQSVISNMHLDRMFKKSGAGANNSRP